MRKLSAGEFQEIRRWMYRNARPLDLARWQYHFEEGDKAQVLKALAAYQTSDNGYGHGLDADNWNPGSSPYTTGIAVSLLEETGISEAEHPQITGILAYLEQSRDLNERGWPFTIPSNSDHPHAPWYTYSEQNNQDNGYHATAGIAGFILKFADHSSALYGKALILSDRMIEKLGSSSPLENHELYAYTAFLRSVIAAGLEERYDFRLIQEKLRALVHAAIERNPARWPVYSMKPSVYINAPESIFYAGNEEVVDKELEYILETRAEGGVWDISWKWTDYPREFAVAENWWKANVAILNLLFLKNFGRIAGGTFTSSS